MQHWVPVFAEAERLHREALPHVFQAPQGQFPPPSLFCQWVSEAGSAVFLADDAGDLVGFVTGFFVLAAYRGPLLPRAGLEVERPEFIEAEDHLPGFQRLKGDAFLAEQHPRRKGPARAASPLARRGCRSRLAGAQPVESLQRPVHALDPDIAVVDIHTLVFGHPGTVENLGHDRRVRALGS
jgi:hypothetical protein